MPLPDAIDPDDELGFLNARVLDADPLPRP
jgi:hypothetical protein